MNLAVRVRSLERKRGGKCPICKGMGRLVITCNTSYDEPSNPPLIGCEGCGEIIHIKIVEVSKDEMLNRQRERIADGKP